MSWLLNITIAKPLSYPAVSSAGREPTRGLRRGDSEGIRILYTYVTSSGDGSQSEEVRHAYGRSRNSVSRMVSERCKINVATALEIRFCTCPVERTGACRSTILGLRIVEKGLYCCCVSMELRSDNFAARVLLVVKNRGGSRAPPPPPPFGTELALNAEVTARLAHVATPTQRTSPYKSLLHVLQT